MSEFEKNKNTENDVAVSGNTAELNNIVDSIINEICIDDDIADLEEFEEETITNDDIAKEIGTPEITDDLGKTKVLSVEDIKIEVIDEPIDAHPENEETKTEDAIKEPAQEELVDVELTEEVGDSKHHKALNKEFLENLEKNKVFNLFFSFTLNFLFIDITHSAFINFNLVGIRKHFGLILVANLKVEHLS